MGLKGLKIVGVFGCVVFVIGISVVSLLFLLETMKDSLLLNCLEIGGGGKMIASIVRTRKIRSELYLQNKEKTDGWNNKAYGMHYTHACNYDLIIEVAVAGPVCEETGMVINAKKIDPIIDIMNKEKLNDFVDNPTLENVSAYIISEIDKLLDEEYRDHPYLDHERYLVRVSIKTASGDMYTQVDRCQLYI